MQVMILGKRWRLDWKKNLHYEGNKVDGLCESPETPNKTISIDSRLSGERELSVLIHEFCHAACFQLSEEFIDEFSSDIGRILFKIGYRKGNQCQDQT